MVERSSVRPGESILISNVSLSTDFEDHQFLAGTVFRFEYGAKQVCLKFDYSHLNDDVPVEIIWDLGDKRAQRGSYVLTAPSGTRMYSLRREDGSILPAGSYAVTIQCDPEIRPQFLFEIY
jgi:hypothetical protein